MMCLSPRELTFPVSCTESLSHCEEDGTMGLLGVFEAEIQAS